MPLTQSDVYPVLEPDQWWVRKSPLSLIRVLEFHAEDQAKQYPNVEVWTRGEPPANQWHYDGSFFGPPKETILWFKSRLDVEHPVEEYKTGTVYISARNSHIFFVAVIHGEVWILADWEVTAEDLQSSYVFQPAPDDPNEVNKHDTRLERVLNGDHSPVIK
jgi:hypothetical protein